MLNKRNLLLAATAAFALQFTAKANDIEPGKEYYTAIKAPNPIVLDGDLSEWKGAQLLADPRFAIPKGSARDGELVFFEEYNGGSWTDPDDQTSAVQVVYDDDNVYFGFTVTDDYHENAANSAWNGDSVQLMIANEARDQQIALYNYALGGIEGETGDIIVNHEAGPAAAADADQTEAVIVRDEDSKRTYYEIKLPKSTLGLDELKGGVRFGLGMAINDGDEDTPGQKGWGGLGAHSIVFGKSPEETAVVTLATSNDIEPGKEFYIANPVPGALNIATGELRTSGNNPIVLDGKLNEWKRIPVLADPRFSIPKGSKREGESVLFEEYAGGSWTGPDDQTSAVQIAYDAENVYFGFVVTDDYHENAANSAWNGDSIQLMIANANQDQQVALYNYALGGVEGETGDIIVNHEAGPAAAADAEPTEAVIVRDERTKRTTYEIKLPKSSLGLETLELGTQFGLGMAINDGDEDTPGQKGWGGLGAHSIVFGKTPGETALVTLGVGTGGGGGIFLSSIGADINSFFFRANDKGDDVVDPASAKLTINGQEVTLEASDKKVDAYDFTYTVDGRFDPNTKLDYTIEVSDTLGKTVSDSGSITTPAYGLLLATMLASDVDTSKPGFNFKVWQSDQYSHGNNLANVEALLEAAPEVDGATVDNDAYADEAGPASDAGDLVGHMMHYEIPTVINLNGYANQVDLGDFQPDDVMPGIPGNFGYYDGIAAEIVTYIEFPEVGLITMGVNSDDGFQLTMGAIWDKENATVAGKAAGVSDTSFIVDVREPGIYPVRIVYYSQGGDAGIELYTENEAGEKTLVNADGGLKAYRVGVAPDYVPPVIAVPFNSTPVTQGGDLSEPTVVNFGDLGNEATYEFYFNAVMDGASTAIAGNNGFAIKLDQWNNQGVFGTTEFGVADNLFEAVDGQSVASVFGADVHVVITTTPDGSSLYINGTLSGTWAGNFDLSGDTKVMGARLEQATDHMGAGSMMYEWATYTGAANASEVQALYESREGGNGANIAFVSFHETDAPSSAAADAGMTEAADIGYTDALKAAGHKVTRVLTSGSPDVDALNGYDLVIISRSVSSGGYSTGDSADAWNSVTSPMLVLGGYVIRNNRMGFTDGSSMVDTVDNIQLKAEDASHPLFNGVELTDGVTGDFAGIVTWNDQVQRGVSINTNNPGEAGRVIATVATADDPTAGGIVALEFDAGAATTTGGNFAGKRLTLLTGSREAGGVTSETAGIWDLTDVGSQIYLNAVSYLTSGGSAGGNITAVSLADGMLTIEYSGTLKSAGSVTGPFNAVDGASSPYTVAADQAAQFFIAE